MTCGILATIPLLHHTAFAQTPPDFQPGTNTRLGVSFPGQDINPAGTTVRGVSGMLTTVNWIPRLTAAEILNAPNVKIPASALQPASNGAGSNSNAQTQPARFALFMLDIDTIVDGSYTTLLHWYQSDLIPNAGAGASAIKNSTHVQNVGSTTSDSDSAADEDSSLATLRSGARTALLRRADDSSSLTGTSLTGTDSSSSDNGPRLEVPYLPPTPPPGPSHRYVLALFAQLPNYSFPLSCYSDLASPVAFATESGGTAYRVNVTARLGFDVNAFARAAGLQPVPVAGNYFKLGNGIGLAKMKARSDSNLLSGDWLGRRRVEEVKRQIKRPPQPNITPQPKPTDTDRSLRQVECQATASPSDQASRLEGVPTTVFVTTTKVVATIIETSMAVSAGHSDGGAIAAAGSSMTTTRLTTLPTAVSASTKVVASIKRS
jgi:hypothetical protein